MAISVLMTVFNGEQWLEAAIQSVLDQTFTSFEFVIVDDGSTDATPAILRRVAARDERVRIFRHENMGVSRSVNRVLPHIQNEWIARFDADDLMLPERLERQLAFLQEHPDVDVASCFADYIDGEGAAVGHYTNPLTSRAEVQRWLDSGKVIHFIQSGAIVRRRVIEQVGGYRPEFNVTEDTDLWNRIAEAGHTVLVQPEVLMQVRIHERSLTRSSVMLQVRQFRWLQDCANRRRSGKPEIAFDEFLKQEGQASLLRRLNTARQDHGQLLYKRAALAHTSGSSLAMLTQLAGAGLIYPSHVFSNIWSKWLRGRTASSEAQQAQTEADDGVVDAATKRSEQAA